MRNLPDLPSELILLALDDLEKSILHPDYEVSMSKWHLPEGNKCYVCLAGSVMAHSLNAPRKAHLIPNSYDGTIQNKLSALDHFRIGDIETGLRLMNRPLPYGTPRSINLPVYTDVPHEEWKGYMLKIVAILQDIGY